jgi:2-oxoglutarate dehydrogenase E2 component (dihydrolipoamide succinyltransferase)
MPVELIVPAVGESITEVQIAQWRKNVGERAEKDENLVEIESDKATVELPAPVGGTITQILKQPGEKAQVGEIIGYMTEGVPAGPGGAPSGGTAPPQPEPRATHAAQSTASTSTQPAPEAYSAPHVNEQRVMPAAERMMATDNVSPQSVTPTGPGGRTLKEDVQRAADNRSQPAAPPQPTAPPAPPKAAPSQGQIVPGDLARRAQTSSPAIATGYPREEEFVVMSPIRRRIAERLVEAQQTAALLTTFNEVDMSGVMELRKKYREQYEKQYGVKLGFMSFFVKAVVDALKNIPQLNAEMRDPHVVYRNYYDIGIAVGGGKGLVVPVLRNAEFMSFAEIEQKISDFGARAKDNKLKLEELQGGTFTISNGGVYGSMLSTPIINPPQSGILGLHAIQDRPVVKDGQVVARPMMYLALTYDHRIVDGREAVVFLKRIKDTIEEPTRMLLEV